MRSLFKSLLLSLLLLWGCAPNDTANTFGPCVGKCDGSAVDTDGDGVFDDVELHYGMDPLSRDTDLDGIEDGFESIDGDANCDGLIDPLDPASGPATDCTLYPGVGVGDLVQIGDSYEQVRAVFLEEGLVQELESNRAFLEGRLQISFGDLNLDGVVDPDDPVVAITAMPGFSGSTLDGLGTDLERESVQSTLQYSDLIPEHSMVLPDFPPVNGGEALLFYTQGFGLLFNDEIVSSITIHKAYGIVPDGLIDPEGASLDIGGTQLQCGDGREGGEPGASQDFYISILGPPDFTGAYSVKVPFATVFLELDFYTFLGLTLVRVVEIKKGILGTERPEEVVMVIVSPPYAGSTTLGIDLGSPKGLVESGHGMAFEAIEEMLGFSIFKYELTNGRPFGVLYENEGATSDDGALLFLLNMAF